MGSSSSKSYSRPNRQVYQPPPVNLNALSPPQDPWVWHQFGGKYRGRPTVVHCQIGSFVFVRGEDHVVYVTCRRSGEEWTEWFSLDRTAQGDIAAVFCPPDQLHVFIRGWDNDVYHRWYGHDGWDPSTMEWTPQGIEVSGDIAVTYVDREIHLFAPGIDCIWHNSMSPRYLEWREWARLEIPAFIKSRIQVVTPYVGRLDLFMRGNDNIIYHLVLDRAGWRDWEGVGGPVRGEIVPVCVGQGCIYIFALNSDCEVCYTYLGNTDWSQWDTLPGQVLGTPAIMVYPEGGIELRTVTEEVGAEGGYITYSNVLNDAGWTQWQRSSYDAEHTPKLEDAHLGLTVDSQGMLYARGWGQDLWMWGPQNTA